MATGNDQITAEQRALIESAHVFFVASVAADLSGGPAGQGPVNLSPKGAADLHVVDERCVAYLDYTGSGNETARHAAGGGPCTIMVMSMDGADAAIVRLYGHASVSPLADSPLAGRVAEEAAPSLGLPPRQVVTLRVEQTATSCGYGVPIFEYVGERTRAERGRRYKA